MADAQSNGPEVGRPDINSGTRSFTREQLYDLVWETPLTRLSKEFGLSDVGLRKICVKHVIPTPPLGWWAKRAHGKPVRKRPLPPLDDPAASADRIILRMIPAVPEGIASDRTAALTLEAARPAIVIPVERPAKLHPVAAATSKALHAAKADREGFKHTASDDAVSTMVAAASINRVLCIIDGFARALTDRGYTLAPNHDGVRVVVDGVSYEWRFYELKDRVPHVPSRDELKNQAGREAFRARYPTMYASSSKAYRSFDGKPSGRLGMTFFDATRDTWRTNDRLIGRWRDSKNQKLETRLGDIMAALVSNAVTIKHRLAEEAEEERLRQEDLERQRQDRARREREKLRQDFIFKKADEFARFEKLSRLAEHLKTNAYSWSQEEPVDWLVSELEWFVALLGRKFERDDLNDEIKGLNLYAEGDRPTEDIDE